MEWKSHRKRHFSDNNNDKHISEYFMEGVGMAAFLVGINSLFGLDMDYELRMVY